MRERRSGAFIVMVYLGKGARVWQGEAMDGGGRSRGLLTGG
jgi:hypothetical protein